MTDVLGPTNQRAKEVVSINRFDFAIPFRASRTPRESKNRGQSIVEFALALPFMLLIMVGTIDLGRMFFDYIDMRSAVVDGAQYASRNPTDTSGISARTFEAGIPAGTTVSTSMSGACTTTGGTGDITVSASYTFQPLTTGFLSKFGLGPVNLAASSTMRCMT
jgi:Flp pilus assembly protein TadG